MLNSISIGTKIARARKNINLSQAELAQQVSISPQAVGKWERGESLPDITTLNKIAEIFGVDLNYFSENFTSEEIKNDATPYLKEKNDSLVNIKANLGLDWDLSGDSYVDADFSGLSNVSDKLRGSSFKKCKFEESDLSNIYFKGNSIKECNFIKANLSKSKFYGSELNENSFRDTSFVEACFEGSEIRNCDFTNAKLIGFELNTSEFRNNLVEHAMWKNVSFKDTQFTEIVFSGILEGCTFSQCSFSKTIFKNAILKKCFFKYSDLKRVSFIGCQVDNLTYEFLKNCKADLAEITKIN